MPLVTFPKLTWRRVGQLHWALGVLSAAAFFGGPGRVTGEEYRLDGTGVYQVFRANGKVGALRDYAFSMSVDGSRWRLDRIPIRFVRDGKVRVVLEESCVASSDGTNVYYLMSFPTNALFDNTTKAAKGNALAGVRATSGGETNRAWRPPVNTASGEIRKGAIPYDMPDSSIQVMWYAFASASYFAGVKDSYIYPVHGFTSVGEASKDFRTRAQWELSETSPKLPKWVLFSAYEKFMDSEGKAGRQDILRATNCVYQVKSYTNCGTLTFPGEIFAQYYVHPVGSNYSIARLAATVSATVTGIVVGAGSKEFTPAIRGETLFSDIRPVDRDLPVAAAMGVGTRWPDAAAARVQYAHAVKVRDAIGRRAEWRFRSFRAVLAALCILPLGFALWRRTLGRTERDRTNTERNVNE